MITSFLTPARWAQHEFGLAQLGDKRRTIRLVNIAAHLAANPGGTLPGAFPEWTELKAAYRFLTQGGSTYERILAPHLERTRDACRQPGEYLIIEDTTCLDYTNHPATEDLGVIGDGQGRGFDLHTALAVRVESWTLDQRPEGVIVGLFDQQCRSPRPSPKGETRAQRLSRPRKSQTWASAFKSAGRPPNGSQWIYVADRESDFYEPLQLCQQHGVDYVIRACQDRRLAQGAGHLMEALAGAPVLGETTVEVRSRAGEPARTAIIELRSVRVDFDGPWRPGGKQPATRAVGVVEAKEVHAPEGVKQPLHWILLTSLPVAALSEIRRVIGIYTKRWLVEEYHKALKSGAAVEQSQLERGYRLESLIGVLAVVAVRLLNTKLIARSRPDSFEAAESFGPEMLTILEKKIGKPKEGWTNEKVMIATARLGGFIGRKSDGMPGWQTIWRGWHRLMWMLEGANLMLA
jgi:hypothetical protein